MPRRDDDDDFEDRQRRRRPPRDEDEDEDDDEDRPRRRRPSARDEDDDFDDRPRRRRPAYEEDDDRPRRRRRRELAPPSAPVTAVGIVNLAVAILFLGLLAYTIFRGGQILNFIGVGLEEAAQQGPNDPRFAQKMQQVQGMMTGLFVFLSGCFFVFVILPLILAGVGVLLRRQWGRVLTILIGIVTTLGAISGMERFVQGHTDAIWGILVLSAYSLFVLTVLFIPQFADEFE